MIADYEFNNRWDDILNIATAEWKPQSTYGKVGEKYLTEKQLKEIIEMLEQKKKEKIVKKDNFSIDDLTDEEKRQLDKEVREIISKG